MNNINYNKIIEKIVMPITDKLLNFEFMSELRTWRQMQWKSKEEIYAICLINLNRLLSHSVTNIPYYKQLGIQLTSDPIKTLKSFPILTKDIINKNINILTFNDPKHYIKSESSGSTGKRVVTYQSSSEFSRGLAIQTFLWEWSGYRLGDRIIQLGINPNRGFLKAVKDIVLRTDYQPAFYLNKEKVIKLLKSYRFKKDVFFGGYASGLYSYAQFCQEANITDISFKSVISWGDKLFPHYRETIENQFHTRVYDIYGCSEGLIIAGQCEYMNYHILTPHIYLELLDDWGQEVNPGEMGNVIVTRLDGFSMPLIRYKVGDLAILGEGRNNCPCGRGFPLLGGIIGRDTDIIKTRSGKVMIVHFFTGIFEHIKEISQFKVIQKNLDEIEILYVPAIGFKMSILDDIRIKIQNYLKEPFPVHFKRVHKIEPSPSGKPRLIESEISKK